MLLKLSLEAMVFQELSAPVAEYSILNKLFVLSFVVALET